MIRRLLSLMTALLCLLLPAASLAETDPLADAYAARMHAVVCSVLDGEGLVYEVDEEYGCCCFSVELLKPSSLGDCVYLDVYAYEDGVNIICTYAELPPEASRTEVLRLCNHFSSSLYLGKFYLSPYTDALCYELFIPLDAADVSLYDQQLIADYVWLAVDVMDYYQDYFLLIIEDGEIADHVLAMWEADEY